MQALIARPRQAFTATEVQWMIEANPSVVTSAGLELLDMELNVLADISAHLRDGEVTRNSYADVHEACSLSISTELDWGQAIVRPHYNMRMPDGRAMRFNLGAYFTVAPDNDAEVTPRVWEVEGLGLLDRLHDPVGDSYAVGAGIGYLAAVETVLMQLGYTRYVIDPTRSATALASARTWGVDENPTWLGIVNDLLGAVGYAGIYQDWDGVLHAGPYQNPTDRPSEWTYYGAGLLSTLYGKRTVKQDLYRAPNKWVFFRNIDADGPAPVEGNGKYTFINAEDGPTSVRARGGRVITKGPIGVEAADQAALVAQAQATIAADLRPNITVPVTTAPNPLHWHFDVVTGNDPALGPSRRMLVTEWKLPLPSGLMSQTWSVL